MTMAVRMPTIVMRVQIVVSVGMVVAASVVSMGSFYGAIEHGAFQSSEYCAFHTLKLL